MLKYFSIIVAVCSVMLPLLMRLVGNIPPAQKISCYYLGGNHCPQFIYSGHISKGWEDIITPLKENFDHGYEIGSQLTIYHLGEQVVDITTGYADTTFTTPYANDTLQLVFSSTKFVTAMAMSMLVDRKHLDLDTPIASYWPDFAKNGKESITVGELMSHAGGLHSVSEPISIDVLLEEGHRLKELLENTEVDHRTWRQKGKQGYHGLSRGLYANEICKLVDPKGRSINSFIEEEVLKPLQLHDLSIGLKNSSDMYNRVSDIIVMSWHKIVFGFLPRLFLPKFLWENLYDDMFITDKEMEFAKDLITWDMRRVTHQAFVQILKDGPRRLTEYNKPSIWMGIHSPSSSGYTRAAILARLANVFAMKGVDSMTGLRLMSEETVAKVSEKCELLHDASLKDNIQYTKMGFADMATFAQKAPWFTHEMFEQSKGECMGWAGAGGSMVQYCPSLKLAIGYSMNRYGPHICDWRGPSYLAMAVHLSKHAK